MKRYPFGPLEASAGTESTSALAAQLDVDANQVYRWRRYGVTADQADRLATRLGLHSFALWPELEAEATRRCDECGDQFVPTRKDARFCRRQCRQRNWARTNYRRRADSLRARRRAYYAECGEYERQRHRSYLQAMKAVA